MDALQYMMIVMASCILLMPAARSMTPDQDFDSVGSTEDEALPTTPLPSSTTHPAPRNCMTPHKTPGVCAARGDCDYSIGPIDQSLYRPSWYISSCLDEELCCPLSKLIPSSQSPDNGDTLDEDKF